MDTVKILLAGLAIGVVSSLIDRLFMGVLFHKYQALTPGTRRKESPRHYSSGMMVTLVFGFLFAYFYSTETATGGNGFFSSVTIGFFPWVVLTLPFIVSVGIFVNWYKMVWLAPILDWLTIVVCASVLAMLII